MLMSMKKIIFALFIGTLFTLSLSAQEEEEEKGGWKKDHLFIGTTLNLGFSNGFIIGLNPEIGYSINKVIDAGIATNFTYVTQRSQVSNSAIRYLALGGGPFVRIWPIRSIFIGGQYEYNRITISEKINGVITDKFKTNASSILVGAGYGTRMIGQSQFYTSIMIDALNDENSPYRDSFGRVLPVFRTGFIIYLGRGNKDE
jgi:opacity protein-like surface antigen